MHLDNTSVISLFKHHLTVITQCNHLLMHTKTDHIQRAGVEFGIGDMPRCFITLSGFQTVLSFTFAWSVWSVHLHGHI